MNRTIDYKKNWLDFNEFQEKYQKKPIEEYPNNVLKSMPKPEISILLITYQHKKYFRQAIESILMQQVNFSFEIIIGEDDSTDGTRELCIEYAKKFPSQIRLFLHKKENKISVNGIGSGIFQISYGLFSLRGKYFAITSGDDFWTDPLKLQKQYDFLNNHPHYSMCFHPWKYQFEVNATNQDPDNCYPENTPIYTNRVYAMLGKNVFSKLPKQFLEVLQDDTFIKNILMQHGKTYFLFNISPSTYRIHRKSMYSSTSYREKLNQRINRDQKMLEVFGSNLKRKYKRKRAQSMYKNFVFEKNNNLSTKSWFSFYSSLISNNLFFDLIIDNFKMNWSKKTTKNRLKKGLSD